MLIFENSKFLVIFNVENITIKKYCIKKLSLIPTETTPFVSSCDYFKIN